MENTLAQKEIHLHDWFHYYYQSWSVNILKNNSKHHLLYLKVFGVWIILKTRDSLCKRFLYKPSPQSPACLQSCCSINVHISTYHAHVVTCGSPSVTAISHARPPSGPCPPAPSLGQWESPNDKVAVTTPHPRTYSWGPAAPHFSGSFIHGVTVPMGHGGSVCWEGVHRESLCFCSAPQKS